jgi:APA family basic amino acid/polyamine antiporter
LAVAGSFEKIIAYFIFVAVVFLTLTGAGLFVIRSRDSETVPGFLTPWYPLPLAVFLVLMSLLLVLLGLHSPQQAILGSLVVLAGLPVYSAFRHKLAIPKSEYVLTRDEILKRLDFRP